MNTGISPGAKWFTLCLPFFQYLFFHCKFTISISVSVCRCKSKVPQNYNESANIANSRAANGQTSDCGSDERRKI